MDQILMSGIELYGWHGVLPEENRLGQRFVIDVVMHLDLRQAGRTDDLALTVNYAHAYEQIQEVVTGEACRLIETVAERIASALFDQYTVINAVDVKVTKPHPPFAIHGDGVAVQIHRKRASN